MQRWKASYSDRRRLTAPYPAVPGCARQQARAVLADICWDNTLACPMAARCTTLCMPCPARRALVLPPSSVRWVRATRRYAPQDTTRWRCYSNRTSSSVLAYRLPHWIAPVPLTPPAAALPFRGHACHTALSTARIYALRFVLPGSARSVFLHLRFTLRALPHRYLGFTALFPPFTHAHASSSPTP